MSVLCIYILHIFSQKFKPSYPDSRQFSILIMFIFLFFFFRNVPEIDPMSSMAVRMVPEQLPLRFPGLRFHLRLLSLLAPPDLLLNDLGWIPFKTFLCELGMKPHRGRAVPKRRRIFLAVFVGILTLLYLNLPSNILQHSNLRHP